MKPATPPLTSAQPSAKRRRLAARQDTVLTSCFVPRALHRRLRRLAVDLNWTQGEILRQALDEWLARHAAELPQERRR